MTVFSAKGGCGKTTLATNIAAVLADHGRREVCLIDLDLAFGDVAIALHLMPTRTIADAVPLLERRDASGLHSLSINHSPGLTALVAPIEPETAESISAAVITELLSMSKQTFDYVVVDTPPAFDDHVLAAFDHSDLVALVTTPKRPSVTNLKRVLETLDLLRYPRERCRIVINRGGSKIGPAPSEVELALQAPVAGKIPRSRDVPASIDRGVPIVLDDPMHPVSRAIFDFVDRSLL